MLLLQERLRIERGRLLALRAGSGKYSAGQRVLAVRQCENAIYQMLMDVALEERVKRVN